MEQTKELTTVQSKALDLRDYLNSDRIKNSLAGALPKWLSVDRMLKVVFSTAMKNPKILECTKESILQSVMQCAQLGLEPILGRAYLVPYFNSKNINGRWVKVYECQMQPGYQGLIDLARRSGTIADVWGANVYENDDFDIEFGMDRGLRHKPWYMVPEKRKSGDGGDVIGAYVVWLLKDGTKHPEFMPIHEIHKRREKSQAYQWAETGETSKGGGKKDSVWHQWPEDMNLKTVLKHSAKFVPSSIEFMSAVETDNEEPTTLHMGVNFGSPQIESPKTDAELAEQFDTLTAGNDGIDEWLTGIGQAHGMSLEKVKAEIIRSDDLDNCMTNFQKHQASQKPPESHDAPTEKETLTPVWDYLSSPILERYSADKREILKQTADRKRLDVTGKKPAEVHQMLCDLAQGDFDDQKLRPATAAPAEIDVDLIAELNELWTGENLAAKDYANDECGVSKYDEAKAKASAWIQAYREFEANM